MDQRLFRSSLVTGCTDWHCLHTSVAHSSLSVSVLRADELHHEKTFFSGFMIRSNTNTPAQLQKMARGLKFRISEGEGL